MVFTQLRHSLLSAGYLHSLAPFEVRQERALQIGTLALHGNFRLFFDTAFDINAERYPCYIRCL